MPSSDTPPMRRRHETARFGIGLNVELLILVFLYLPATIAVHGVVFRTYDSVSTKMA
jgi:hypothetical protein